LQAWDTGARFHLLHSAVGLVAALVRARLAAGLFVTGNVLFAGSLYALVAMDRPALGAITPFGGVSYMAAWIALAAWR
jgi:uncharacterized membrane protein YgdD (TMEM256/DUF423 family)